MKNKIQDLRNHLFATLESLQDKDNPMPIDRAKAIADVAQVVVNSAKVEVDFLRAVGEGHPNHQGTGFIPVEKEVNPLAGAAQPRLVKS